jgi:uncharacterized protein (DUF1778 family)
MHMSRRQERSPSAKRTRDDRLGFRLDRRTKALVKRAARLESRSLTDFCLTALADAAERTIARRETLELSARDREAFFSALVNPPAPNARLRRAFREHRRRVMS